MMAVQPFTKLMSEKEISVLRQLHGMLENDPVETREQFTDLMKAAFQYGRLDAKLLSNELGYSPSTVYRWIDGLSAPHKSLWPTIVQWISHAIEKRVALHDNKSKALHDV
jgi:predicted DNA-binding transcriptional regulator AlpA